MTIDTLAHHSLSGETGVIDDSTTHPDGVVLVRINDHWFFASDCTQA